MMLFNSSQSEQIKTEKMYEFGQCFRSDVLIPKAINLLKRENARLFEWTEFGAWQLGDPKRERLINQMKVNEKEIEWLQFEKTIIDIQRKQHKWIQ